MAVIVRRDRLGRVSGSIGGRNFLYRNKKGAAIRHSDGSDPAGLQWLTAELL
jgi:hypothetical protein